MNKSLLLIPVLILGAGFAHAQPLEEVQTSVRGFDGDSATVEVRWNHDSAAEQYEVGCVSCIPNVTKTSTGDSVTIAGVTAFSDNSIAMLYVIAYDSQGEIIDARQILVDISR